MGTVYKASQSGLNRIVAVKILHNKLSQDKDLVSRFHQEARLVAKLNHPHIVAGIDTGESDGKHYFVMEFLEGGTLALLLENSGVIGEKKAPNPRKLKPELSEQFSQLLERLLQKERAKRPENPQQLLDLIVKFKLKNNYVNGYLKKSYFNGIS